MDLSVPLRFQYRKSAAKRSETLRGCGVFGLVSIRFAIGRRRIGKGGSVSPCGCTPFAGMEGMGRPVATIMRGAAAMRDDEGPGEPSGRLAAFD
ncbi:hypothetical protein E9232_006934 [Inquilinus ginsengisoli]|uniref:Uncharacterized protein n=1 Tax=Inquilinus ginsengisoli TaxID=363840 RepID=A0ABU1K0I3_9PROT|nr:hypothetical protein [Inquilinus ginsengisoli]MDR6294380.1 hypothetical protein [Inquilinus ginsengisoli]